MTVEYAQGLLDTDVMILRKWINADELPAEVAISAVTLAELSAGPHEVCAAVISSGRKPVVPVTRPRALHDR